MSNPGVVPRAIQHVFDIIEKTPGRDFLLRMSMMEIYNEVQLTTVYFAAVLASLGPACKQLMPKLGLQKIVVVSACFAGF